jgi:hypothetical protein
LYQIQLLFLHTTKSSFPQFPLPWSEGLFPSPSLKKKRERKRKILVAKKGFENASRLKSVFPKKGGFLNEFFIIWSLLNSHQHACCCLSSASFFLF